MCLAIPLSSREKLLLDRERRTSNHVRTQEISSVCLWTWVHLDHWQQAFVADSRTKKRHSNASCFTSTEMGHYIGCIPVQDVPLSLKGQPKCWHAVTPFAQAGWGKHAPARRHIHDREVQKLQHVQMNSLPLSVQKMHTATKHDPDLSCVMQFTTDEWPSKAELALELLPYYKVQTELTVEDGCLLRGMRVVVPEKYQSSILEELHQNHPGIVCMKSLTRLHVWWPELDSNVEQMMKKRGACQVTKQACSYNWKPMDLAN